MKIKNIGTFAAAALITASLNIVQAEEGKKPAVKKNNRPSREAIVKRFDKEGDGKLIETERKAATAAVRKRYGRESDLRRQRIETARKKISAAMKAGEITEKQAKQRMAALKKRISQSQSKSGNNRAKSDSFRRGGDYRARLMKEFDKNGDGKLDEAERNAARKSLSPSRSRGGSERASRSRKRDNARAADRRRRGGDGENFERRRSERRKRD